MVGVTKQILEDRFRSYTLNIGNSFIEALHPASMFFPPAIFRLGDDQAMWADLPIMLALAIMVTVQLTLEMPFRRLGKAIKADSTLLGVDQPITQVSAISASATGCWS